MAYRSSTKALGTNDSVTITKPAGVVDGDWVILAVRDLGSTVTWPSGFTTKASATTNGAVTRSGRVSVAWKLASSEPTNYTITLGGGNGVNVSAVAVAISGRSSSQPVAVTTSVASSGSSPLSIPLSGFTAASSDDAVIINAVEASNTTGAWVTTAATNYTSRQDQTDTGAFYAGLLNVSTRDALTSGATGTLTSTATLSGQAGEGYGIVIQLAVSGGATATALPGVGAVNTSGLTPSMNPFTNVRIREVLINEAGSPVANQTGIHLLVWYSGFPSGAADLSYSNMTTDPTGTTSWSLATGTLIYNQRIFYVAHDGHASLSVYTCAQMQPTYS